MVLDFLGLTAEAQELAIDEAMTQRMSQTLAEFGHGFAFYGRQYHLDVEGENFFLDLLLVHVPTHRFVVVEIKAGKFRPEHLGYAQRDSYAEVFVRAGVLTAVAEGVLGITFRLCW